MRFYVGCKKGSREVFSSAAPPTVETHGKRFAAIIGPFRTKRAADLMAVPGSMYTTVADAERAARGVKLQRELTSTVDSTPARS